MNAAQFGGGSTCGQCVQVCISLYMYLSIEHSLDRLLCVTRQLDSRHQKFHFMLMQDMIIGYLRRLLRRLQGRSSDPIKVSRWTRDKSSLS